MSNKSCLITISGGIGKSIMSTSLIPELAKKYDDIFVLTAYPIVFKEIPEVTRVYDFGQDIYRDIVLDESIDILNGEPYNNPDFIRRKIHLFDAWREEWGLDVKGESIDGADICSVLDVDYINKNMQGYKEATDEVLNTIGDNFAIVQFNGGQSPRNDMNRPYDWKQEGLKRNYFDAQKLINLYHEANPDTKIIQYGLANEPAFENCIKITKPTLTYLALAAYAKDVICIDSSLQHMAAKTAKHVFVIWGETGGVDSEGNQHPGRHFGYNLPNVVNIAPTRNRVLQPFFAPLGSSDNFIRFETPENIMKIIKETHEKAGD